MSGPDIGEVAALLYRYARAVDSHDWELYRSVFTADAVIDYGADVVVGDRDQVVDWMNAETWFTADEAVAHGFADRIADGDAAKARAAWNVAAYANAPKAAAPAEPDPEPAPVAVNEPDTADADHAHRLRQVEVAALNPA